MKIQCIGDGIAAEWTRDVMEGGVIASEVGVVVVFVVGVGAVVLVQL